MEAEEKRIKLMEYLYGEMSTEKRLAFEKELETDPELKKEMNELKQIRSGLSWLEDKEVMEPFFLSGRPRSNGWTRPFGRRAFIMFKPYVAIAAMLILVLIVGYLVNFRITYGDNGLYMGFDQATPQQEQSLTRDEVLNLVKNEIAGNNALIMNRLESTEEDLNTRFASLQQEQKQTPEVRLADQVVTQDELDQYYQLVRDSNAALIENFLQTSTEQQQEYFQAVLTQFSDYLREQREEDLRLIRRSIVSLKESQDQQKQETEQILTTLINNVNTQNN